MKKILFFLMAVFLWKPCIFAQCGSGSCPSGSINTLPAGGIIATGTTYCISGTINNTTDYTVNGTLIIQAGSVTVGNLTVGKTGSIFVNSGARFMANSYTGAATAPASAISNVTVCPYGYLYLSGAINPGETNFTVSDNGAFVIHGSWSTIINDTYFKLGMGSVVEMCSSFVFNSSTGFFTETSGGASYVVTRSAMANGAGGGYLSTLGAASQIKWDIPGGPIAWVTHPAANTCVGPTCTLLPPGSTDDGVCGSVANSSMLILLPLQVLEVRKQLSGGDLLITATLEAGLPAEQVVLESAENGTDFSPTSYNAVVSGGNRYLFTLPASAAGNYYRVEAIGDYGHLYSKVLPPSEEGQYDGTGQTRIYPNPAANFVYVSIASNEKVNSVLVFNSMGQEVGKISLPMGIQLVRCELPASLPVGVYFIRLVGTLRTPVTVRVIKTM
jgi:hypothetical protein